MRGQCGCLPLLEADHGVLGEGGVPEHGDGVVHDHDVALVPRHHPPLPVQRSLKHEEQFRG